MPGHSGAFQSDEKEGSLVAIPDAADGGAYEKEIGRPEQGMGQGSTRPKLPRNQIQQTNLSNICCKI